MAKIIKVEFKVGTTYVGSDVTETLNFDVTNMSDEEIERMLEEEFEMWVWENIDCGYKILK